MGKYRYALGFVFSGVLVGVLALLGLGGCSEEYLGVRSDKAIVVPTTLADLRALLDNTQVMNVTPALGVIGGDDLFTSDEGYLAFSPFERNCYLWEDDLYKGQLYCGDWDVMYQQVFYANVVLEQLNNIQEQDEECQALRGGALFYRAHAFYQLAQIFAGEYGSDSKGIPIRVSSDVTAPVTRATLQETYDRIILDLVESELLLPKTSSYKTRPSGVAADALLSNVYLLMSDFVNAEEYATKVLAVTDTLLDYNALDAGLRRPVPMFNDEVLFHSGAVSYYFTSGPKSYVDTLLYASYDDNDLRKAIFYRARDVNRYTFKGNYTGLANLFGGLSTNEVYLIRAECRLRNGNAIGAREDLNRLLEKRWVTGTYIPVTENDEDTLLRIILVERRKELAFRGNRWMDLRRLNNDPLLAKALERTLDGKTYSLPPGDKRYVYSIPQAEILNSGIEQNPRQ